MSISTRDTNYGALFYPSLRCSLFPPSNLVGVELNGVVTDRYYKPRVAAGFLGSGIVIYLFIYLFIYFRGWI